MPTKGTPHPAAEAPVSWEIVNEHLRRWHTSSNRQALHAALVFLEPQFRLMIPARVKRTWPADLVEDALRTFLLKLVETPLPAGIKKPKGYLARSLKNHCIDAYEARVRRRETPIEDIGAGWEPQAHGQRSPAEALDEQQRARLLHSALQQLAMADRVVLKLAHAPEWLSEDELSWLGQRLELGEAEVQREVAAARDTYALTCIFDPGDDDPQDPVARRLRMERFRRRRARAREKLRGLLQEELS